MLNYSMKLLSSGMRAVSKRRASECVLLGTDGTAGSSVQPLSMRRMIALLASLGRTLLESVTLGDIPGVDMVMIDGIVRCGRSRNTPPAAEVPVVVAGH